MSNEINNIYIYSNELVYIIDTINNHHRLRIL